MKLNIEKILIIILSFSIIIVSSILSVKYVLYEKNKEDINIDNVQVVTFKNVLLKDIVEIFREKAKENNIELAEFKLVKFDNKTYFYSNILNKENVSYLINYEGLDISEMYVKITEPDDIDMETMENIITTLIMVSDENISLSESKRIYATLLTSLEDNLKVQFKYLNGLIYIFEIEDENNIIFYIK